MLHISIYGRHFGICITYYYNWKTLWYVYYRYVAQAAAAGAFIRYGAAGRLGRRGCSRSLNRVAPSGGDGGLRCRSPTLHTDHPGTRYDAVTIRVVGRVSLFHSHHGRRPASVYAQYKQRAPHPSTCVVPRMAAVRGWLTDSTSDKYHL